MRPSVHHHLVAPPKTSHRHLLSPSSHIHRCSFPATPCSPPMGCCPSAIPLHILPQNSPCPTTRSSAFLSSWLREAALGWEDILLRWYLLCGFGSTSPTSKLTSLEKGALLSSAELQHLSLMKILLSLTASNHQLASLPRQNFYPFC